MPIYCPSCATEATGDVRFCKKCGANLRGASETPPSRDSSSRFDWSKTWVADMLLTAYAAAVNRPAFVTSTVAELTGTPAATFRQWADDHVHDFLPRSPAKQ